MDYIGLDPTAGRRPITYALLRADLSIGALDHGDLERVVALAQDARRAVIAIDAPYGPSRGLTTRPGIRRRLGLDPHGATWREAKVAEVLLRQRNIRLYLTPRASTPPPAWMAFGFGLYARLERLGFRRYAPGRSGQRRLFETYPYGAFAVLLGRLPDSKHTAAGLRQRQGLLRDLGLDLPARRLLNHDALDALVAAYTAWLAGRQPARASWTGHAHEGHIVLPGPLKDWYD